MPRLVRSPLVVVNGSRSAIEVGRTDKYVSYIPHTVGVYRLRRELIKYYDATWRPLDSYSVAKAARTYLDLGTTIRGITNSARKELERIYKLSDSY